MSAFNPKADLLSVQIDFLLAPTAEVAEAIRPRSICGWGGSLWEAGLPSGLYDAASTGFSGGA
jgi:hypothetical protein